MKPLAQFATATLALGALLAAGASHATDIAELPLKASVLAKPNVIFGMDDSGSMDSEVMLYNNDGAFWWNYDTASGWGTDAAHPNPSLRSVMSTWFNAAGGASSTWRKMVYLFPNGTGTGKRVYADAANHHFAILPTTQFAFTRWSGVYKKSDGSYATPADDPAASPVHNPLYYNPLVTYAPWAPAQLSTGAVSPVDATTTAVKSHPIYGTGTFDLAATGGIARTTSTDEHFTAFPGMRIPAGSRKQVCDAANANCGAWTDVDADENASATGVTRVAMAYFPATYWVKEACTVPAVVGVGTDGCTTAPDGSTLKRYEIKSGNTFPSGRSYTAELQNFANWFQYYRKRKMMLAGAMGATMENLSGMRLGVLPFNSHSNVTLYDADATAASSNRLRVAGIFYEANGSGGTPTRETLKYIGEQYKRTDTDAGGQYNVVRYACQRNNAFIVTDGFANASSVTMPGWDSGKSASDWGSGAPYETTHGGSLADLALRYFTNNPRGDLATGKLQTTPRDANPDLHMNTYGLTLGARGTVFLGEDVAAPTSTSAWPVPDQNRNPTSVDDLWHATINGRGKMYLASTPQDTALRIQAGLSDILSQVGAQGSVAVSTVNLARGDSRAYVGRYNPAGWAGDLMAVPVNPDDGTVGTTAQWSAAALLDARDWTTRTIASWSGSAGIAFTEAAVGTTVNPGGTYGTTSEVVDYLRGDRTHEGSKFRRRTSVMGAVINSEPAIDRDAKVVYVASGEGMLHAFEADPAATQPGRELWAYVPGRALATIGQTSRRGYVFATELDGSPVVGKIGTGVKLLVAGMGAAGRGYFAIDVSSPRGHTDATLAGKVKWEFPSPGDATTSAKMGQTLGRASIVKTAAGYVVLVASGYNGTHDGKGRLWMLNASTGAVLKEFVTSEGSLAGEAGLAHVSPFGEANGNVRFVYGGDLLGNLWRFDLEAAPADSDAVKKVARLKGPTGADQSVTAAPELLSYQGKRIIYVGTGRLLDIGDFGSSAVQTFYAIADGPTLSNARSDLEPQVYNAGTDTLTGDAVDWASDRGWYVDLPAGRQLNTRPSIAYGAVAVVGNFAGASNCAASSRLYVFDVLTGGKFAGADFVSSEIASNSNSSAVTALVTTGHKVVGAGQTAEGTPWRREIATGAPIPPGKNAWREVRR